MEDYLRGKRDGMDAAILGMAEQSGQYETDYERGWHDGFLQQRWEMELLTESES